MQCLSDSCHGWSLKYISLGNHILWNVEGFVMMYNDMLNFIYALVLGFNMVLRKYARCKGTLKMVPKRYFNFQFPPEKKEHNIPPKKSNLNAEFLACKTITSSA
jgi:hypothetical protein